MHNSSSSSKFSEGSQKDFRTLAALQLEDYALIGATLNVLARVSRVWLPPQQDWEAYGVLLQLACLPDIRWYGEGNYSPRAQTSKKQTLNLAGVSLLSFCQLESFQHWASLVSVLGDDRTERSNPSVEGLKLAKGA
uniref:Uncharacterized protein n=1 Tax=Timema tahoe TaxID=61484 RepID=A0A7R9NXT8_9NEOP|nr:unnamed protein product [Timema tahoe]